MRWVDIPHSLKLVTPPAQEPITYAQAKAFLRLPDDTEQAYVASLCAAARQKLEGDTGLRLITQTWDLYFDLFPQDTGRQMISQGWDPYWSIYPQDTVYLPFEPLQSVSSIKTTAIDGTVTTLDASNYTVDLTGVPPRVRLSNSGAWPGNLQRTSAVVMRCVCGFGTDGTSVPAPLLQAMYQVIAAWYMYRSQAGAAVPMKWFGYDATIDNYRIKGMG